MKAETLQKRLEKRYKKSKNRKECQVIKDLINGTNKSSMVHRKTIRPCFVRGRGRFISNADYTKEIEDLLILLGVKYKVGNDAPKGGLHGNYIKIQTKIERDE